MSPIYILSPIVNKTTTPALTHKNIAAKARAYLAEDRKDSLSVLNFSGYIIMATDTAKTDIMTLTRIIEPFWANKRAKRIIEIRLANSARRIELTLFSSVFISVRKVMESAIKTTIPTATVPKTPTEERSSNTIPLALSKRMFHSGEPLKLRSRKREKL